MAWYISAAVSARAAVEFVESVRVSNPTETDRGTGPRPVASATNAVPAAPAASDRSAERKVLVGSGIGLGLAVVGLVVTLLTGSTGGAAETSAEQQDSDPSAAAAPASSASAAPRPAPAPRSAPVPAPEAYLADMTPTSGPAYTGSVVVGGVTYPHAIYQQFSGCNTEVSHTYALNREWSGFSATAGIGDGADPESVLQFELTGDGKSLYSSKSVPVKDAVKIDVPVTGVQNLTMSFSFVAGDTGTCTAAGNGVWGDPALTK